jgi:hypothetical protein
MGTEDDSKKAERYFEILSHTSNQINWLVLTIFLLAGLNFSSIYNWYFSNFRGTINLHNSLILEPENLDNLFKSIKNDETKLKKLDETIAFSKLMGKDPPTNEVITDKERKFFLKKQFIQQAEKLSKARYETLTSTLPIISGIKSFISEYNIIISVMATIFLGLLLLLLEYSRNTLKFIFNDRTLWLETEIQTIYSLFFMILPGLPNRKTFNNFILLFYLLISSIIFLFIGNIYDISTDMDSFGTYFYDYPNYWQHMGIYIGLSNIFLLICIFVCIIIIEKAQVVIKDIRNLIILLRWGSIVINPMIELIYQRAGYNTEANKNLIEYLVFPINPGKKVYQNFLTFKLKLKDLNEQEYNVNFKCDIDISDLLKKHFSNLDSVSEEQINYQLIYSDKELSRNLVTTEIAKIRIFFKNILFNYDSELRRSFVEGNNKARIDFEKLKDGFTTLEEEKLLNKLEVQTNDFT